MIVIIGCIIVIGSVLGGFSMAGGHFMSLVHASELVTIGGSAMGALIMMSSKKVLLDLAKGLLATVKGSPFNKAMYADLFKLMYELTRLMRRSGLLALEPHLNDPHNSELFKKYPRISHNHHVLTFLCDGFAPLIEGSVSEPEKIRSMLDAEIAVMAEEHHLATGVLQKTADGLPGFGIVAAVLGIVITMGAIDGPVEEIGHKVGAALVGTFLGILLSYGFFGPLAARMELLGAGEIAFFRTMANIIVSCTDNCVPRVVIEQARRGVGSEYRPARDQLEVLFKEAEGTDAAAA
ncbi:MAG: flagellar motor stator protein MotA [Planctomycetaceae bacterium]|nr:flagellar motor stator protein MotA [Planctomycetaceae bacterium]